MVTNVFPLLVATAAVSYPWASKEDVAEHLRARALTWSSDEVEALADVLYEQAEAYDLDPELVLAVMSVESRFEFRARSQVGALGLMQIMPRTGELFAPNAGVRWRGSRTLFDPEANIRIGTRYLAYLLQKFDGDLDRALTSYCHGIGRVKRTLETQGALSHQKLLYSRRVRRHLASLQRARSTARRRWGRPPSPPRRNRRGQDDSNLDIVYPSYGPSWPWRSSSSRS